VPATAQLQTKGRGRTSDNWKPRISEESGVFSFLHFSYFESPQSLISC
jgi:biotin-(acetyl-CoA carboxylase) ligase